MGMTRNARRPLLLLTGAVVPVLVLTACASASSTAPTDASVAIPAAAKTVTLSAKYHSLGEYGSARSMATRVLQVAGVAWKLPPFQWPAA
jgi:hypothetical protein